MSERLIAVGSEEMIGEEVGRDRDPDTDGDTTDEMSGVDGVIPHLKQLRHRCLLSVGRRVSGT